MAILFYYSFVGQSQREWGGEGGMGEGEGLCRVYPIIQNHFGRPKCVTNASQKREHMLHFLRIHSRKNQSDILSSPFLSPYTQ
jgi:hypothetical protein